MPELPQIEPTGEVRPAGIAPAVSSPLPEAVEKSGNDLTEKAFAVHHQLVMINRYAQFHQADAEFVVGQANIDKAVRQIPDPDIRAQTTAKQLGLLKNELVKKYPQAGIELGPQLDTRVAEGTKQAIDASIVQGHNNAIDNLKTTLATTNEAFATALDDRDAQHIMSNGHDLIDKYLQHGAIGLGEAGQYHRALEYGAHLAAFNHVADMDAVKAMDTPNDSLKWNFRGQEMNISPQDYLTVQSRAQRQENRKNDVAADEYKSKVNVINTSILDGSITPEAFADAKAHGMVSSVMYQYHEGHRPFSAEAAAGAVADLNSKPNRSQAEIDQWSANYAANVAPYNDPDTNRAVAAQVKVERGEAGTRDGQYKRNLVNQAYTNLDNQYQDDIYGPHPDVPTKIKVQGMKADIKNRIMGAKDEGEAQKIYDDSFKKTIAASPEHVAARVATGKGLTPDQKKKLAALPPP